MSDKSTSSDDGASVAIGEIQHGPSKAEIFFEKNLKLLILGALLLVIAVAAFVIVRQLNTAKAQEAGSALVSAETPEALRKVTQDFEGSPSAISAQLMLAQQLWSEGKEEEGLETYRSLEASGEDHPAVVDARFALATIERSQGNLEKAEELFQKILGDSTAQHLHPMALISLGDLAKAAGDDEKAKGYYNRKLEDYSDFIDQGYTVNRLNLVGVDSPEKVGPPPAPEPTSPQFNPTPSLPGTIAPPIIPSSDPSIPTEETPGEGEQSDDAAQESSPDPSPEGNEDIAPDKPQMTDLPPGLENDDASETEPKTDSEDASQTEDGQ